MRVIGVIDLIDGLAVHAVAGQREGYTPVQAIAGETIEPGDALALAQAYLDRFKLTELYAADLDAILGGTSQDALVARLTALGAPLWLDSAVSSREGARHALTLGTAHVVVGLETLPSYDVLRDICDEVGGDRVAFSLDLKNGEPIIAPSHDGAGSIESGEPPGEVVARARDAGAGAVIVIDLARVGTGKGLDVELITRVRRATAGLTLVAGGGVRGSQDLTLLAEAGCDGALVATSIHEGRLDVAEIADAVGTG